MAVEVVVESGQLGVHCVELVAGLVHAVAC